MAKQVVLIVDDHPVVRQGLAAVLEQEAGLATREATGIREALRIVAEEQVELVVSDLMFPLGSGLDLIKDIRTRWPHIPVVAISVHRANLYAERVLAAGGIGYLEKGSTCQQIVDAVRRALRGEMCFDESTAARLALKGLGLPADVQGISQLSDRELAVFELYGQGLKAVQIAERLFLGRKTVDSHRERIREKLGLSSNSELIRMAVETYRRSNNLGDGE